jgi:uncharacterized lipoprotein YddW (UPF0748 family)
MVLRFRFLFLLTFCLLGAGAYCASPVPPLPAREFRGLWIASVANIDWPSEKGLDRTRQKAELKALFDQAVALGLNAVILQVRPGCDALYESTLEPWSEYLTGKSGQSPGYDPLAFAVAEARLRGLELHAWFNPFRARHKSGRSELAANHIAKARPDLVKAYGSDLWLDPGEAEVQARSIAVIRDVVRRYDIDGVHIDDYFYPYPVNDRSGRRIQFPDNPSWAKYGRAGGKLARDDWRRSNVDRFIERLNREIHAEKPWVKFGISPFGIWRPKFPASIQGFDAYTELYADARKWMLNGWADYFSPQLYWALSSKEQSLPVLLDWWSEQNARSRHLWPGLNAALVGTTPRNERRPLTADEMLRQIATVRKKRGVDGMVFWNASAVGSKPGLAVALRSRGFVSPALVPASPWLDAGVPGTPDVDLGRSNGRPILDWKPTGGEAVRWWAVQSRAGGKWTTRIQPAEVPRWFPDPSTAKADFVAVTGVSRTGVAGRPKVVDVRPSR